VLEACTQLCTLYGIAPESALVTTTQSLQAAAQRHTAPQPHGREPGSTSLSDIVEQLMHNTEASNSLCIVVLQRRYGTQPATTYVCLTDRLLHLRARTGT
jgi:hypothetical protein